MKLLKNWKFLFLISLIVVYSMFGVYVFSESSKLPSENFSRHIEIANLEADSFQNSRNASTITSLELTNGNLALLYYDNTLNYIELSSSANIIKKLDLGLSSISIQQLKLKNATDNIVSFYMLEESKLYSCSIDINSNDLTKEKIYDNVKSIHTSKNYITIVLKDGYTILNNTSDSFEKIYTSNQSLRKLSNLVDDGNLSLAYLANDDKGIQKLWYYTYTKSDASSEVTNITTIPSSGNYSTSAISLLLDNNLARVLHEGTDYKTGFSTLTLYEENKTSDSDKNFDKNILSSLKSANASTLISSMDNTFEFVARIPNEESDSEIAQDIYLFTYENYELVKAKRLSKSGGSSANPNYMKTDTSNFLLWTDSIGLNKRILIAGDNEEIINTSYTLSKHDKTQVFMDIIFTLYPTLFAFILPILSVAGPIIFMLIVLSFANLTYLERNGKKILPLILALHVILKFRFIYSIVFETLPRIREFLPPFISNLYILTAFIALLTLVSFAINYLKNPKFFEGQDIWMNYISFMLIDLIIAWIAVMPYLYMWIDVSAKNFV